MHSSRVTAFLFFYYFFLAVSGVQRLTLTPDRGTTLNISSQVKGSACKVCSGARRRCDTTLVLKDSTPVVVEFDCRRPEDVFRVEIIRNIECTTKSCSGDIIQADSGLHLWLDFHRTFTWNLKASVLKAIQVDFSKVGLRQMSPSVNCPDRHAYTMKAFQATGTVVIGKYCRAGPISSAQILNEGSFSLDAPPGLKLQSDQFGVSVGEEIKSLAKITVSLPHQSSSIELLSPNFPESFPDDDVMEWYFHIEAKQKANVEFLNLTQPRCLKKETAAEYHSKGREALVLRLTDTQPVQNRGDFTLTLRNCEMDRRRAGSPGLSVKIKVSASRASSQVLCGVDLRKMKVLSLHLERLSKASECEMKMNSVTMEKITVPSGSVTQLSFQDCLPNDVLVTASGVIGCTQLKDCPKSPVPLSVPSLPSCLPGPLRAVTWALRPPLHGTVELTSSIGPLQQHLPGQPCNDSIITVSEDDGATVGHFCPQGAIQKVQIHTKISVTVTRKGGQALRPAVKPLLMASLKEEIAERYIFTVSPKRDKTVLLATPGWPEGMESYATVSWIMSLPPKMEAHLMFFNISQPKCANRHTNIRVQRIGSLEEDYSRREDEEAEETSVAENFYLNMSNCMPERGDFKVITELTLQKNMMLVTIVSVVAALVLLFIVVLVVVCFVIKKKKKKLEHQVSIYNPNGTDFRAGHNGFPKSREDNESHVYASIEDTLVYTHLLRKGAEMGVYTESDTYQPFMEQTLVSKDGNTMEVAVYQDYLLSDQQAPPLPNRPPSHNQALVDNVIYQSQPSLDEHSAKMGPRLEPEGGN
ncbi:CUB domain-containing protein 1a isoform X2 [Dunckerocampus dactyliophorus]|uniref:CUB domain-containing protein 1a isoform X2 n=1 Tax=Dunckerocampus dactyliophorus TaxID=161453 RepID=UPI0024070133|nr:CUB domain-containing protein 1a isoform X2 [Dunckerocampus dactyliophorus]